jgi:predicted amidohydrolase
MKQIAEHYRSLKPTIKYFADEVVIAQAWKKTHGYIRSFNWYADTLALDVSALNIEDNSKEWAEQIKQGNTLNLLELVPAAKSEAWLFDENGWHPKAVEKREAKSPLRPLAHLTVRDQTWASAAMLCLADAVETAQGNCSNKNFEMTRAKQVYSYGNRLVCDWNSKDKAWFRWGNSETYRKFFTDYQNFLIRPLELGRLVSNQALGSEDVFIVNLDLSKFYNTIDVDVLIERLQAISLDFGHAECGDFWPAFKRVTKWQWTPEDIDLAKELNLGDIETGLPQGLVSAGFYANAYLDNFDKEVGKKIGSEISNQSGIVLHDYCRYVDDLRLVISVEDGIPQKISTEINKLLNKLLKKFGGEKLELNTAKTKVTHLTDLDNSGSMAKRIKMIQSELSGPADRDVLDSTTGILENLLTIEDEDTPTLKNNHSDLALLQITSFDHDIRPDTLKRFAANRLENIVRSKRRISPLDNKDSEHEGSNELLAKKLISAWMKDPSLALVLRKAIEIYPDAELFEPVFQAIFDRTSFSKLKKEKDKTTNIMMDYLLADLFRCASDFNGYFQVITYPAHIKPTAVIELLARYAHKVIAIKEVAPFTVRQALMLLAVINRPVLFNTEEDSIQKDLHSILVNKPPVYNSQRSALFEVAAQITDDFDTYAALFIEHIEDLGDKRYTALELFAKRGGPFWLALWKRSNKKPSFKSISKKLKWASPQVSIQPKPRKQLLSKIICSDLNGFEFEHALIKLAIGLVTEVSINPDIIEKSPNEITVKASSTFSWDKLWLAQIKTIECKYSPIKDYSDPRFSIPTWINSQSSEGNRVIYWIGTILRTSVLGDSDFTDSRWKSGKTVTYKGVRSSWYKRRMGMMHAPESVVGEFATVSGWFSDLLMRCLQWPGFESSFVKHDDVRDIIDLDSFSKCLNERLSYLNGLICDSSSLPVLPTEVHRPSKKSNFRIVTVQQLLPRTSDFSASDIQLNNNLFRAKHRDHLLAVCQLTVKTLETKLNCDDDEKKPSADLIVFPEVAVHIDDQDVIKRLADKTQSIVFAGLVFTDHKGKLVNIARWFIPDYRESGRQWVIRDQGKENMTLPEQKMGITGYRPCQHILKVHGHPEGPFSITGAICYDATDIRLAADLRDKTELFVIAAHNKDVNTFDNMASALQYHMFQHVVISNVGEFGGSTIQAPFREPYDRLISHVHGVGQIAISTADIDLAAFKRTSKKYKAVKTKPAGI